MYNTYLDELYALVEKINKRKLTEVKMQMSIAQNPHVKDPSILWKELEKTESKLEGKSYREAEFDAAGFEALKSRLRSNPRIVVK